MIIVVILLAAILWEVASGGPAAWWDFGVAVFAPNFTWRDAAAIAIALHVIEEHMCGFREHFNLEVMKSDRSDRPVRVWEAILKDEIGLATALIVLIYLSPAHPWMLSVAVGFIAADVAQHLIYSVREHFYTPGTFTAVLGYIPLVFVALYHEPIHLLAALAGAAGLAANFATAWLRRKKV